MSIIKNTLYTFFYKQVLKLKPLLVVCIIAAVTPAAALAQNLNWVKSFGEPNGVTVTSIAVDNAGNVYTLGYFIGTADFDPGPGTYNLSSTGAAYDIYVSKLDASGNFEWAKLWGSTGHDLGISIAVDASGNVYSTGWFGGTVDFDPGAGTSNLISNGDYDTFISKLDASGNFIWAKNLGGVAFDAGYGITVDADGNVYITGAFSGTGDFDPGAGIFNLVSAGSQDIFVSKLDASGNFIWAKKMGGTSSDYPASISLDADGNVYTTGYFQGTADFDPGAGTYNLVSAGSQDIFVSKLDAAGNFIWAKKWGGTDQDKGSSLKVDASGNVYSTGIFSGTVDFDPGAGTSNLSSAGGVDIFISKLDASGNFAWAKKWGGTSTDIGSGITVDDSGDVYTTGYFHGTADFDPGPGTVNISSAGNADIFICKLDASGNYVWVVSIGGTSGDVGSSIAVDAAKNVYANGTYSGTVDFDPGAGTFYLSPAGSGAGFVIKLSPPVLPIELLYFTGDAEPDANKIEWATATEKNSAWQIVERSVNGLDDWTEIGRIAGAGNSTDPISYKINDENPLQLSYYRLAALDFDGSVEYSEVISIQRQAADLSIGNVFPVPAEKEVSLEVNMPSSGEVEIYVHNALGQLVYFQKSTLQKGSNAVKIDLQVIPAGNYTVTIGDGYSRVVQPVIKM